MKDYRISPPAEIDLAQIWHYIAADNPLAANAFIAELLAVMTKLQIESRMGRPRGELQPGMRSHPHGKYLILYRVVDDIVVVSRIINGARDIRRALNEPPKEPPESN
jgi:toxin ParE1/3/4